MGRSVPVVPRGTSARPGTWPVQVSQGQPGNHPTQDGQPCLPALGLALPWEGMSLSPSPHGWSCDDGRLSDG